MWVVKLRTRVLEESSFALDKGLPRPASFELRMGPLLHASVTEHVVAVKLVVVGEIELAQVSVEVVESGKS